MWRMFAPLNAMRPSQGVEVFGEVGAGLAAALEPMPKCTMFRRTAGFAGILPGRAGPTSVRPTIY